MIVKKQSWHYRMYERRYRAWRMETPRDVTSRQYVRVIAEELVLNYFLSLVVGFAAFAGIAYLAVLAVRDALVHPVPYAILAALLLFVYGCAEFSVSKLRFRLFPAWSPPKQGRKRSVVTFKD